MIRVQSALMREKIQRLLTEYQGSIQFSFDHEQGISLFFTTNAQNEDCLLYTSDAADDAVIV